jgi:phosphoglycerol transferase MdoB-like AlkP superfamily enzyme
MKAILHLAIRLFFMLVAIFLLVRVLEYSVVCSRDTIDFSFSLFFERSVNLDSFFVYLWSIAFLLICLLVSAIHQQIAERILQFLAFALVVIHLLLTGYFLLSNSVLNSSVLEFSAQELVHIIGNEISLHNIILLLITVLVAWLAYILIYKTSKKINPGKWTQRTLLVIYLLLGVFVFANLRYSTKAFKYFDSGYAYLLGNSKETLFVKSFDNASIITSSNNIAKHTAIYRQNHPEFSFSNQAYPLMHNESYSNVLGPFFVKDSSVKPNIVLIISESLSSSFSGKRCTTPVSLTPYIDSLARHGLSWNNFLSNAERSHGVITNVLASLPSGVGQRGFINMHVTLPQGKFYPDHETILEPLHDNDYTSSFYYGGWGYYDRTGYFIEDHGINYFATEDSFSKAVYKRKKGPISWGYNDKDLYHMSQNLRHNLQKKTPFIDIYQTLSLHTPYNLVTAKYESKDYIIKRLEQLGTQPSEISNVHIEIIGSIFFSDDALKQFMTEVQSKKEYENTIFIITGDHGIDYPVSNRPLEKYQVPLVIYSNLLVKNANFNGYCSHIDLAPSILALLQQNFGLELPAERHWMGSGLDTSSTFRNNKQIPLAVYNDNLAQYISGKYIKYNNHIVQFDSALATTEVTDPLVLDSVNRKFENYLFINEYTCGKDRIWKK